MRIRSDDEGRDTPSGLTTEDLAHPVTEDEGQAPVYPGEATEDREAPDVQEDAADRVDPAYNQATPADPADRDEDAWVEGEDRTAAPTAADTHAEAVSDDDSAPLLGPAEAQEFRQTWSDIQGRFVDDPQDAVRSADALVAEVMQTLAGTFAAHKQELEVQWSRGEEVETEDLRQALRHYRSFFNRLLKT